MEEVLKWWCSAGLIAFGLTWLGLAILCIAALVFDCFDEKETKLTTPLPMTDPQPSQSAGSFGSMNPLAGDVSQDRDGRLTVRRRIRVG